MDSKWFGPDLRALSPVVTGMLSTTVEIIVNEWLGKHFTPMFETYYAMLRMIHEKASDQ